jgi:hypothetical protein
VTGPGWYQCPGSDGHGAINVGLGPAGARDLHGDSDYRAVTESLIRQDLGPRGRVRVAGRCWRTAGPDLYYYLNNSLTVATDPVSADSDSESLSWQGRDRR